jgi:hypothetical protein
LNRTKNNNSILFLTTLGVYIGLLMAGASPTVIAQQSAAMARSFDVKDEIEVKDDLDNKPDADAVIGQFALGVENIYRAVVEASVNNLVEVENGHYDFFNFITVFPKGGASFVSKGEFNHITRCYGNYTKPLINLYDAFLPRSEEAHEQLRVDFQISQSDFEFCVNLFTESEEIAEELGAFLSSALLSRKEIELDLRRSYIYSRTKIDVERDRLMVVTHLPRADLDPLLAMDAK